MIRVMISNLWSGIPWTYTVWLGSLALISERENKYYIQKWLTQRRIKVSSFSFCSGMRKKILWQFKNASADLKRLIQFWFRSWIWFNFDVVDFVLAKCLLFYCALFFFSYEHLGIKYFIQGNFGEKISILRYILAPADVDQTNDPFLYLSDVWKSA